MNENLIEVKEKVKVRNEVYPRFKRRGHNKE